MANEKADAYDAARIYWQDLDGKSRSYQEVAKRLGLDAEKKAVWDEIGRLVRNWEAQGYVRHSVLRKSQVLGYWPLLPELEDRLRRKFGLRDVIVVDISTMKPPIDSPESREDDWNTYDDRIHQLLGRWGGRLLSTLLRDGDVVATGGGRGPHYTAENCILPESSACFPKKIVSLTGSMSTRVWGGTGPTTRELDADNVAMALKGGLMAREVPALLNCPITETSKSPQVEEATIALTGIGALGGGHRLRLIHHRSPELKKVADIVEKLNVAAERHDPTSKVPPFHHWVGDVCNFYFLVDDGYPGLGKLKKTRTRLQDVISELNSQLVNTPPDKLSMICQTGAVVAVAGGPHKASAMHYVLRQDPPWVSHLITDSETARVLTY